MDELEQQLAVCQMNTLQTVLSGSTMDIETALVSLSLVNKECLKLAKENNLDWIAKKIVKLFEDK